MSWKTWGGGIVGSEGKRREIVDVVEKNLWGECRENRGEKSFATAAAKHAPMWDIILDKVCNPHVEWEEDDRPDENESGVMAGTRLPGQHR